MKIYTRQGDSGETQVYAKQTLRVSKDDHILDTYGTLDELNAHIGLLVASLEQTDTVTSSHVVMADLKNIQHNLFQIGFAISDSSQLSAEHVEHLEIQIDKMQEELPPQRHFILPGGTIAASQAHVCRTVCRRAERVLVGLGKVHQVDALAHQYLNRLSDYLFVIARALNHGAGVDDIKV